MKLLLVFVFLYGIAAVTQRELTDPACPKPWCIIHTNGECLCPRWLNDAECPAPKCFRVIKDGACLCLNPNFHGTTTAAPKIRRLHPILRSRAACPYWCRYEDDYGCVCDR